MAKREYFDKPGLDALWAKIKSTFVSWVGGNITGDLTINNLPLARERQLWDLGGTALPSGADFDTYTTPGLYYATSNATVATFSNCPDGYAGRLIVKSAVGIDGDRLIQEWRNGFGDVYSRYRNGGIWRLWREYISTDNLIKNVNDKTIKSMEMIWGVKNNANPDAYPRVKFRTTGDAATSTLDLDLIYETSATNQKFYSLMTGNGEFLEGIVKIKSIQRIAVSNSSSVAAGANATLTGTLNTSSGATTWFFAPIYVNFGYVRANITRSGTTVSVPVYNASGAAHTMSGNVLCIGY